MICLITKYLTVKIECLEMDCFFIVIECVIPINTIY
jgi:hypothetical protein